jgi:phosphoserine phosphatase
MRGLARSNDAVAAGLAMTKILLIRHYWRIAQDPCCINEIDIAGDGKVCVRRLNETYHLDAISAVNAP